MGGSTERRALPRRERNGSGAAAQRAVDEMEADETLRVLVKAAGKRHALAAATDRFLEGVVNAGDYEDLVARSDAVKAELRANHL